MKLIHKKLAVVNVSSANNSAFRMVIEENRPLVIACGCICVVVIALFCILEVVIAPSAISSVFMLEGILENTYVQTRDSPPG